MGWTPRPITVWMCLSGHQSLEWRERPPWRFATIEVDLAKNVLEVHGVDRHGKAVLREQLRRDEMHRSSQTCRRV